MPGKDVCGIYAGEEEQGEPQRPVLPQHGHSGPERPTSLLATGMARGQGPVAAALVLPHHGPRHPRYSTHSARLDTFRDSWPPALRQRPHQMAEAGLVYIGRSDQVRIY